MTPHARSALIFTVFALSALPRFALASQSYPEDIRDDLELGYKPECTICHQTTAGGKGTVRQPFGRQMMQLGAVGKNPGSMLAALHDYDTSCYTVDGDLVPDVQELRDHTNPNRNDAIGEGGGCGVVPAGFEDLPIPQTGCSTARTTGRQSSGQSGDDLAETLVAFALASMSIVALRIAGRKRRRAM